MGRGYLWCGALVLVVGALCLVLGSTQSGVAGANTPTGAVAHSAYGVQVSIPRSWRATYYDPCPYRNTLNIGAASYEANCPAFLFGQSWVSLDSTRPLQPEGSQAPPIGRRITVHGVQVVVPRGTPAYTLVWYLPSAHATLDGSGPLAALVMRTLMPATRRAIPAPGIVTGHEYLEALIQAPVTGPVTITNNHTHHQRTIHAFDGGWGATLPPGLYTAEGHDGNVFCPPVTFRVVSGLRAEGVTIQCQGD